MKNFLTFVLLAVATVANANDRQTIGWSFAISNDSLGDQHDRWQSSSFQLGYFRGKQWEGSAPSQFGELLEYRVRADHLTPEDLALPAPTDRRHAGVLSFGVHTHFQRSDWEFTAGGDLVAIGPQTGLLDFQEELHRILGFQIPDLDNFQIEDQFRINLTGEVGRTLDMGDWTMRPFVEVSVGPEDMVRAGVDLSFGNLGRDDLLVRALATGHRVPAVRGSDANGTTFILGFDTAWVADSVYLPENLGYELTSARSRVRAGFHHERAKFDVFYGLAWLEPEFEAQPSGQFVGTLQVGYKF